MPLFSVLSVGMVMAVLLLHALQKQPLGMRGSVSEVVLVPSLWC